MHTFRAAYALVDIELNTALALRVYYCIMEEYDKYGDVVLRHVLIIERIKKILITIACG